MLISKAGQFPFSFLYALLDLARPSHQLIRHAHIAFLNGEVHRTLELRLALGNLPQQTRPTPAVCLLSTICDARQRFDVVLIECQ